MPIHVKQKTETIPEPVPTCPFCETEMQDLGVNSEPAHILDLGKGTVHAPVWLQYHRFICHGCGFEARFQDGFLKAYKGKTGS